MKILHLLSSDRFSGAENVACIIMQMMRDKADSVYCSPDGPIREAVSSHGLAFAPITALTVSEVKRILKIEKPDLVHAHDVRASLIASLACGKIPFVSHIHSNSRKARKFSAKSLIYAFAAMQAKQIFWVSKSTFEGYFFHRFVEKKSSVLYNIIDVDTVRNKMKADQASYDYDIVYVGRLTYQKNPQRLISVLARVIETRPETKVAIIGEGDLTEDAKQLCKERNIDSHIDFLGFIPNPLKIVHDAKIMLMTSRWEGTPMCALEALALGTPIVGTPTDGLCELIENDQNGYLSDNDKLLAEKLFEILNSSEKRKRLSEEAKRISLVYNDMETYKDRIADVYFK